ncbi:Heat-labile A chain [Cordyceps militaris]|uniref:Heat-labile A chain n=1 Tax=Cordyceps militaris TaxID=73501 RepID=A0A2H4SED8_CORMI|nr:Heat-labile A chain [Cordyceps militaris]
MILFHPVLALLGFATFVASYSIAGSVERMYFYYAYKLDRLTPGNQLIAPGCDDCTLDEFIKHISKDKSIKPAISTEPFPDVVKTAEKIAKDGYTGIIELGQVVKDVKNNYAALLQKVGERVLGKLESSPSNPANLADFEKAKAGVFEAMKGVYNERTRAAVESFKPFAGDAEPFKVISTESGRGMKFEFAATVEANPGKTKAEIKAAWKKHIEGGHEENIVSLANSIKVAKDILCPVGGSKMKRRALLCGEVLVTDPLTTGADVVSPPPKGEEVGVPPKGEKAPSELGESAKLAEEISEKEFAELAAKRGLDTLAKEKWQMSLSEVRTKLKYEPLKPTSPKVGAGGFKAPSIGGGAVAVVGGAFWVYGVVDAFTHNVTALDRAAAITAIIPFVGCAVSTASAAEKGDVDGLDSALCFLGDGLLLTPAFPLGIAIHVVRAIMSFFKPPALPTLDEFQGRRDRAWARFLRDDIYTYIYSHESYQTVTGHPFRSEHKTFREKLESALAIEQLAVLSEGAQSIGAATASAHDDAEAADTPERKAEIAKGVEDAAEKLREATHAEIVRRQRKLVMNLPKELKEKHDMSLQPTADQYNADFIKSITEEKMVNKYKTIYPGDPEVPGSGTDDADEIRVKLKGFGDQLRETPPALPRYFDLAYIVGQSRSLLSVDNATLSVPDYIRDLVPSLSETAVQLHAIHHTLQIARLLNGKVSEAELSTVSPTEDAQGARDVQTLVALKYGRVYDEYKFRWANSMFHGATAFFIEEQMPGVEKFLIQPQVPPVPTGTEDFEDTHLYVSLAAGLSEAIVDTLKGNADALGKRHVVGVGQAIMDRASRLQEKVGESDALWVLAVEGLRKKDAALVQPTSPEKIKRTLPRSSSVYRAQLAASALVPSGSSSGSVAAGFNLLRSSRRQTQPLSCWTRTMLLSL